MSFINPETAFSLFRRSLRRLDPRHQIRNPILFTVYVSAILASAACFAQSAATVGFAIDVALVLWFTVLFSNAAELYAQDKDNAQIAALKKAHGGLTAKKIESAATKHHYALMPASMLKKGDFVFVESGDMIPADGEIIEGIASVDESSITGESAPVIREADSDRSGVTWGTRVLSDWIIMRVTSGRGETTLDRVLAMIEGTKRQASPNEVALNIFLIASTLCFVITAATLYPFSAFLSHSVIGERHIDIIMLIALFVCLTPTTIGGLMPAIGIAGASRLLQAGILTTSSHAVEAAGDVNILLLDKTGTITYGNRQAVAFFAAEGVPPIQLVKAALLSSLADDTPEGKSIVSLALSRYGLSLPEKDETMTFIPFSADTRMSGVKTPTTLILKGAGDAVQTQIALEGGRVPADIREKTDQIARQGGTPMLVVENNRVLGLIQLKDVIKTGIKARLAVLRAMGIRSVMMTGDNPLTAAAVAAEAGVDDFIAQAVPETKLKFIRNRQEDGDVVAMVGDGANDAPALAQADIAMAMESGAQEAKEASNMIDMESNPTKLIEVVRIGKQLLMTRGSLATFSLASDISKFLSVVPAVLISAHPVLAPLNFMGFSSPESAVLASLLFNALVILFLIPLALHGITFRPLSSDRLLRRHIVLYGIGGITLPAIGIKLIDMLLSLAMGAPHA
ncbi:MAG TPA: K(+)-transporting ATPase subunit B [Rhodospirillaceae bacterium]|nr:K(+)-transporting ATPase subunit B [Rhodospirillaceae bacterium]